MNNLRAGSNFALFLLFFGVAALDAIQTQDWLRIGLWMAIGFVFLVADNRSPGSKR
jgi:hypothetical protein